MVIRKQLSVRLDSEIYQKFIIATTARHESMQQVLNTFVDNYIKETKELEKQGILKLL